MTPYMLKMINIVSNNHVEFNEFKFEVQVLNIIEE